MQLDLIGNAIKKICTQNIEKIVCVYLFWNHWITFEAPRNMADYIVALGIHGSIITRYALFILIVGYTQMMVWWNDIYALVPRLFFPIYTYDFNRNYVFFSSWFTIFNEKKNTTDGWFTYLIVFIAYVGFVSRYFIKILWIFRFIDGWFLVLFLLKLFFMFDFYVRTTDFCFVLLFIHII